MNAVFPSGSVRSKISPQPISNRAFIFSLRLSWPVVDTSLPLRMSTRDSVKSLIDWLLRPWGHTEQEHLSQAPDMIG
jgi:hypothetical protein